MLTKQLAPSDKLQMSFLSANRLQPQ